MKRFLAFVLALGLAGPAFAQTFPLNNIPIGKGPGKQGWTPIAPVNGQCFTASGGVPTFAPCAGLLTGAALTKVDDTNVTLTLGGSPSTALLNAASLTLGWTGTLAYARGGCNAASQVACRNNIFPTPTRAGDVPYWNGTAWVSLAGNNSGTRFFSEDAAGAPAFATAVTSAQISAGVGTTVTVTAGANPCVTTCNLTVAVDLSRLTNSLGANVTLNNTGTYFAGPTVAQGTSGTWFASGSITLQDTSAGSRFDCKLWDGTTIIASGAESSAAASFIASIALSGYISSPAGNIRIDCKDTGSTNGLMLFNITGNSKDSTVSVFRIQ